MLINFFWLNACNAFNNIHFICISDQPLELFLNNSYSLVLIRFYSDVVCAKTVVYVEQGIRRRRDETQQEEQVEENEVFFGARKVQTRRQEI